MNALIVKPLNFEVRKDANKEKCQIPQILPPIYKMHQMTRAEKESETISKGRGRKMSEYFVKKPLLKYQVFMPRSNLQ